MASKDSNNPTPPSQMFYEENWEEDEKDELNPNDPLRLHRAVSYNDEKLVKKLIDSGFDVNKEDPSEKTPLYYAVEKNYGKIARILIENGADVNLSPDIESYSSIACNFKNYELSELLYFVESTKWRPGRDPSLMNIIVPYDCLNSERERLFSQREQEQIEMNLERIKMEHYTNLFVQNLISYKTFLQLEENDLVSMGIVVPEDRQKIIALIDSIRQRSWTGANSVPLDLNKDFVKCEITTAFSNTKSIMGSFLEMMNEISDKMISNPEHLQKGIEIFSIKEILNSIYELKSSGIELGQNTKSWNRMLLGYLPKGNEISSRKCQKSSSKSFYFTTFALIAVCTYAVYFKKYNLINLNVSKYFDFLINQSQSQVNI